MVEFCSACGMSLPRCDLTAKNGKVYVSHDYECSSCRKPANPLSKDLKEEPPEPGPTQDIVFRSGKILKD